MSAKLTTVKKLLEDCLNDFEKVNGSSFKLGYMKVVFPGNIDEKGREEFWKKFLKGYNNKSCSYAEYTSYPLFENEESRDPSHYVYGSLAGKNVDKGWRILNPVIQKTVEQLYLRLFEPENMPDSDSFLKRICEELPRKEGSGEYLWYEFLLKLSLEPRCSINCHAPRDNWKPPDFNFEVKLQIILTDILEASKRALRFLIFKVDELAEQTETEQQSDKEGDEKSDQNSKSKEQIWDDNNHDYEYNSKVIQSLSDDLQITLATLSKLLKPDGQIRYMRKKRRCKVHVAELVSYLNSQKRRDNFSEKAFEVMEKRKANIQKQSLE